MIKLAVRKYLFLITPIIMLFFTSFNIFNGYQNDVKLDVVVIDPGHGGKDPGCNGALTNEKEVVLSIGLALGKKIKEKYPKVKVIYTRDTDEFIELSERASIANKANADLFICIHANSGPAAAYGVETYVMGLHKSEANLKVADRENSAIYLEDNYEDKYNDFDGSPDAMLALTLQQSAYLKQSINYASKVQHQTKKLGRKNRGVKQAGFVVLYRTQMPSVLIETGFLTNKEEEKYLNNKVNREAMANSFFKAFESYKTEIDNINTLTKSNTQNNISDIKFSVQIAASSNLIELKSYNFKGLSPISYYKTSNVYKYTFGKTSSYTEAKELLKKALPKYKDSFIVAFKGEERISLATARKLTKN